MIGLLQVGMNDMGVLSYPATILSRTHRRNAHFQQAGFQMRKQRKPQHWFLKRRRRCSEELFRTVDLKLSVPLGVLSLHLTGRSIWREAYMAQYTENR